MKGSIEAKDAETYCLTDTIDGFVRLQKDEPITGWNLYVLYAFGTIGKGHFYGDMLAECLLTTAVQVQGHFGQLPCLVFEERGEKLIIN